MIPKSVLMTNYRECDGVARVFNGTALSIEDVQLLNVAFVPILSHNLLSTQTVLTPRRSLILRRWWRGTFFSKSGMSLFAPTVRKLDQM